MIAFITMAFGVSVRTSFSLLLVPLLDEYGWDRGVIAGAFSFGFLLSAILSPLVGRVIDRHGPVFAIEAGILMMSAGLLLAPAISAPWHLYATLGFLVGTGANLMSFTAQSLYLPNWFVGRRGLAISIAFSGVGVGAIIILPWLQELIADFGWRSACSTIGLVVAGALIPLNLVVRNRPQDLGLLPDGERPAETATPSRRGTVVVDVHWAAIDWTLKRAVRTARFWWLAFGYFTGLIAWYAVQVHQTKYLTEIGFSPVVAAWALGAVGVIAIPGQIALGALSDRIGREWVWSVGCLGFAICYASLIALEHTPSHPLLYVMVVSQGLLGYSLTSVMGAMAAEIFEGPHFGMIFGTLTIMLFAGGAAGPWLTGVIHDQTGSYRLAFIFIIACCALSSAAVWRAGPRHIRSVSRKARAG